VDVLRLCFVCLGNICRSPTAAGVMQHLVDGAGLTEKIEVDSAGTSAFHLGRQPDKRSVETAWRHGVELRGQARQFERADLDYFDYVLAMDHSNVSDLQVLSKDDRLRGKIHLLRSFDAEAPPGAEVPDPYHEGPRGFEDVFEICERACRGLLIHLTPLVLAL
jgi:protein-tyrosine phosphatase